MAGKSKFDAAYTPHTVALYGTAVIAGGSCLIGAMTTFVESVYCDTVKWSYIQHGIEYGATVFNHVFPRAGMYALVAGGVIAYKAAQDKQLLAARKLVATTMLATGAFVCTKALKPAFKEANVAFNVQFQESYDERQQEKIALIREQRPQ